MPHVKFNATFCNQAGAMLAIELVAYRHAGKEGRAYKCGLLTNHPVYSQTLLNMNSPQQVIRRRFKMDPQEH